MLNLALNWLLLFLGLGRPHLQYIDLVRQNIVLEIVLVQGGCEPDATGNKSFQRVLALGLKVVTSESNLRVQAEFSIDASVEGCLHMQQNEILSHLNILDHTFGLETEIPCTQG